MANAQATEEQDVDKVIAKAVEAAAKGENVEQLLEALFALLPDANKEKIKQKFSAALKLKKLRAPAEKSDDLVSRSAIGRLQDMLASTLRQAADRIAALVRSRPDVARDIQQAGNVLFQNGVRVDSIKISEADLGTFAPQLGAAQVPAKGEGRGA